MNQQCSTNPEITLDPLRDYGPDALDTHDIPPIRGARLTEIELHWQNQMLGTTTHRAEDIFAAAPTGTIPIPPAATLTQVGLELEVDGDQRPHKLQLRPPASIIMEFPADAPFVLQFLNKRHYLRTLAAIFIALATALAPGTGDGDDDEDDCTTDRATIATPA